MSDRYPGYDVLAKRASQSWNDQTRRVIDESLAMDPEAHGFFTDVEWLTVKAVCARIVPQHGSFSELNAVEQDAVLTAVQKGEAHDSSWGDMPPALFFAQRLLHDIVSAYYAHPHSWNEIGFSGPAAPRLPEISGPVRYPWGPKRPRYPYRPHELNAAALVFAITGKDGTGFPR